jgi:hypothetical protein
MQQIHLHRNFLSCFRNLPVMDRSNDTTDAYVEVKHGSITYKTDVKRKTLNPVFNSNWFRFEIDDEMIQDEPLLLRVMDYDTYSANDAIGKVSLNLSPLLLQSDPSRGMYGWIPIYDTMNGSQNQKKSRNPQPFRHSRRNQLHRQSRTFLRLQQIPPKFMRRTILQLKLDTVRLSRNNSWFCRGNGVG